MEAKELLSAWMKWKTVKDGKEYTQIDLARDSKLSRSNISKLLTKGGKMRNATQMKLAEVFEVDVQQFGWGPFFKEDKRGLDLRSTTWKIYNEIADERLLTLIYNHVAIYYLYEKNQKVQTQVRDERRALSSHWISQLNDYLIGLTPAVF